MNILDKARYSNKIPAIISAVNDAQWKLATAQVRARELTEMGFLCCRGKIDLAALQIARIQNELIDLQQNPMYLPKDYPKMSPIEIGY